MRQLILQLPKGHEEEVAEAAQKCGGKNMISLSGGEKAVFILSLPNNEINSFLGHLTQIEEMEVNLIPRGIISLYPPKNEAPGQVADVKPKSEIEIYLGGIQSVDSLFGLTGYSFTAGIIVWIGLYTATVYLLVAAMLIAPLAGPAMNAALATAAGKWSLALDQFTVCCSSGIPFSSSGLKPMIILLLMFQVFCKWDGCKY